MALQPGCAVALCWSRVKAARSDRDWVWLQWSSTCAIDALLAAPYDAFSLARRLGLLA